MLPKPRCSKPIFGQSAESTKLDGSTANNSDLTFNVLNRGSRFAWEVLNGVGVDGVGGIFLLPYVFLCFSSLFFSLFFVFLRFSSFFFAFLRFVLEERVGDCKLLQNGEFHSDPVCTDPVQNFPICRDSNRLGSQRCQIARFESQQGKSKYLPPPQRPSSRKWRRQAKESVW